MSEAIPLPPRPNLEQYRNVAKDLQSACRSGQIPEFVTRWHFEESWRRFEQGCSLTAMQLFLAKAHGFASWPKFYAHLRALEKPLSPVSQFEAAADAIVAGDLAGLRQLLAGNPQLARERSMREHRSTLLHYVSANGIEDYRQKTPPNILAIAELLLAAGADVNAESRAYGGHSTALGLTATSCHPENAGVQIPLLALLLNHGARLDGPGSRSDVSACLANGRGQAAEYLAGRGARLEFEGAAGVGRLDLVKSLLPQAAPRQIGDGFCWACEFGRNAVVEFLLQNESTAATQLNGQGQSGLHWAAYAGHADLVKLLLANGARVDIEDGVHHGTPLGWALYAAGNTKQEGYYEIVALLVRAGAKLDQATLDRFRSDPRMLAALRGDVPA